MNLDGIIAFLLPHLGNVATYLNAKEMSDIYDETNIYQGIEFPFIFIFVGIQARSVWPAILVSAAFITVKALTEFPTVITMRFIKPVFCDLPY